MTPLEAARLRYLIAVDAAADARKELREASALYSRLAKEAGVRLVGDDVHEELRREAKALFAESVLQAAAECGGVPA